MVEAMEMEDSSSKDNEHNDTKGLLQKREQLSTVFNQVIIGSAVFFWAFALSGANAIAVLKYLEWGMSVIDIANATLISFTAQIFTQVIVAYLSDQSTSKYGRRKPFVFVGNIIRFVCYIFLTIPPSHDRNTLFGWYTVFFSLISIGVSTTSNPFYSWMIESTVDDEDYTRLFSISIPFGGIFGAIVGIGMILVSPLLAALVGLVGGLVTTGLLLYYIPGKMYREAMKLPQMIPSLRICFQTAEFRKIFFTSICVGAAQSVFGGLTFLMWYVGFHIHNQSFVILCALMVALTSGILGMIFIIACNWILKYIEKVKLYTIILSVITVLSCLLFVTTFNDAGFYPNLFIVGTIGTFGLPIGLLGSLFLRDLVVYDTFATNYKRENMYLSAMVIPTSIISQFIAGIPLVVISLTGFQVEDSNGGDDDSIANAYSWNATSVWLLRVCSSFVVAMLAFAGYWIMRDYGLSTKVAEQMNEVNKRREAEAEAAIKAADEAAAAAKEVDSPLSTEEGKKTTEIMEVALSEDAMMATRETEVDGEFIQVTNEERQLLLHLSVPELFRVYSAIDSKVYQATEGLPLIQKLLGFGCIEAFLTEIFVIVAIALDDQDFGSSFATLLIYFLVLVAFYLLYEASRYVAINKVSKWKPHDLKLRSKAVYLEFSRKGETLQHLLAKEGINIDGTVDDDLISQVAGLRPSSIVGKSAEEKELEVEAFVNLSGYKRIFSTIASICLFSILLIAIGSTN